MSLSFTAAQMIPIYKINQFDLVNVTNVSFDGFPLECSNLSSRALLSENINFDQDRCVRLNTRAGNQTVILHQSLAAVAGKCLCEEECTSKVKKTHLNEIECIALYNQIKKAISINGQAYVRPANGTSTDGIAAEKVTMQTQHWVSIFLPVCGYLTSLVNFWIFVTLNRGRNPLSYVMIKSE